VLVSTDTDLTRRAAAGDRDAFERVYAQSLPAVWSFASRRAAGRASAEALAGRILRRAFAELDGYDGQVPFAAWLLAIARRVANAQAPRAARPPLAPSRSHHQA
jgi:DNA-directed RNA polymerase specialized sigma24 family protein